MNPYNRRLLIGIYRIVYELAMDPKVPLHHPLVTAAGQLAYLVSCFSSEIEEDAEQ